MVFPQPTNRPLLTYILLIANAAMFGLATLMGGSENPQVLLRFGAQFGPLIAAGEYWRLFTAMFMHSGVMHIALNGFGLLIFGSMVEQSFGHVRFFIIYILAGLAGVGLGYVIAAALLPGRAGSRLEDLIVRGSVLERAGGAVCGDAYADDVRLDALAPASDA